MKRAEEVTWLLNLNETTTSSNGEVKTIISTTQSNKWFNTNTICGSKATKTKAKHRNDIKPKISTHGPTKILKTTEAPAKQHEDKIAESNLYVRKHKNDKVIYSVYEPEDVENIFNQHCQIGNSKTRCLIDTGADISLIHISKLSKGEVLHKVGSEMQIKSATGNYIKIIGCVKKLLIKINNLSYHLDAYVTNDKPVYTILGVKFILQNPKVLINILQNHDITKHIKHSKNVKVDSI
ncbi:MAG: retropepsin-like aspartic protease, partial [Aeromonas sp.]